MNGERNDVAMHGFKSKTVNTRTGALQVDVPQVPSVPT